MKKAKKSKVVRKTFTARLEEAKDEARRVGFNDGFSEGTASGRREFLPPYDAREALLNFARAVESWPIDGNALVAIVATDLKHVCNLAVPARVMQVIASEMKKRLT